MLLSILFNSQGQPVVAGMACAQVPLGQSYWVDVLGLSLTEVQGLETAVIDVKNPKLAEQLLNLYQERTSINTDEKVFQLLDPNPTLVPRRLAA